MTRVCNIFLNRVFENASEGTLVLSQRVDYRHNLDGTVDLIISIEDVTTRPKGTDAHLTNAQPSNSFGLFDSFGL